MWVPPRQGLGLWFCKQRVEERASRETVWEWGKVEKMEENQGEVG